MSTEPTLVDAPPVAVVASESQSEDVVLSAAGAVISNSANPSPRLDALSRPKFEFDKDDDDEDDHEEDNDGADHNSMLKILMKNSKYGGSLSEFGARRWASKRTEAIVDISEHAMSGGQKSKLSLPKLMKVCKNVQAKKSLRNFHEKPLLDVPLKKQHAKKAARRVNFEEVKAEITKYDPIVREIRHADQLVFPRDQQKVTFKIADQFGTSIASNTPGDGQLKAKKALEVEINEQLMLSEGNVELDIRPLTENELAVLSSRSVEQARAMHREIQRQRLLTSYQESKFRRVRKIKSKTYHRILKKEKLRDTVSELDQLIADGSCSEQVMEKLEQLDKLRALERASLKHHITGKWAKYHKLRAKYDDVARQELNNQMAINAELMKKRSLAVLVGLPEDCDADDDEAGTVEFESTRGIAGEDIAIPNNYNPWISSSKVKNNNKRAKVATDNKPALQDDNSLERFFAKRVQERLDKNAADERAELIRLDALDEKMIEEGVQFKAPGEDESKVAKQKNITVSRELTTTIVEASDGSDEESDVDELPESNKNVNLDLNSTIVNVNKKRSKKKKMVHSDGDDSEEDQSHEIGEFDFHNSEMQKYLSEAFFDDDVVEDFLKEKREKVNAEDENTKPQMYLPGWGNWAGSGIKETRKRKSRQVKRIVAAEKRLDQKIANAIILKDVDQLGGRLRIAYKPANVPDVKTFEQTCAKPVGATWNPQSVFKSMSEPKVITPLGSIIEPMESAMVSSGTDTLKGGVFKKHKGGNKSRRKPLR